MEYFASVLDYDRIQIFLDAHPEKSGFLGSPDLMMVIGEAGGFRDLLMVTWGSESFPRFADGYWGSRWFPGLADGHSLRLRAIALALRGAPLQLTT